MNRMLFLVAMFALVATAQETRPAEDEARYRFRVRHVEMSHNIVYLVEDVEFRIGLLDLDHLLQHLPRKRLDIGAVGRARVGHDRGRVRIDQHDAISVFPQSLAGLGAGIVELAGLADDDGAGPDQENRMEVVATGHG